jgi:hypothetical protein
MTPTPPPDDLRRSTTEERFNMIKYIWPLRVLDLGDPDDGRYWKVTSDHHTDDPNVRAAAAFGRAQGMMSATHDGAHVERWQPPTLVIRDVRFTYGSDEYDAGETVATWAAKVLGDNGTVEQAGSWWADPDGSQIANPVTGERAELTAHPSNIEAETVATIDALLQARPDLLDAVTKGFIRTMLWTDAVPLGDDPQEFGGLEHLPPTDELVNHCRELCARFLHEAAGEDVEAFMDACGDPDGGHPGEYVGHTFYLDAVGSGVSFIDRAYSADHDNAVVAAMGRLHEVAAGFPEVEHMSAYEQPDGTVGCG